MRPGREVFIRWKFLPHKRNQLRFVLFYTGVYLLLCTMILHTMLRGRIEPTDTDAVIRSMQLFGHKEIFSGPFKQMSLFSTGSYLLRIPQNVSQFLSIADEGFMTLNNFKDGLKGVDPEIADQSLTNPSNEKEIKTAFDDLQQTDHLVDVKTFRNSNSEEKEETESWKKVHHSCIVVGSSSSVLWNPNLGEMIDKNYDAVFRINQAPTKNYEAFVGTKTSYRLVYPESAKNSSWEFWGNQTIITLVYKVGNIIWSAAIASNRKRYDQDFFSIGDFFYNNVLNQVPLAHESVKNFLLLRPQFIQEVSDRLKVLNPTSKRPTSGMLGVFLALQMCDHVDVSGFGVLFSRKAPLKVDYYQNMQLRHTPMTRQHSPKIETDLLRLMIREKIIRDISNVLKPLPL